MAKTKAKKDPAKSAAAKKRWAERKMRELEKLPKGSEVEPDIPEVQASVPKPTATSAHTVRYVTKPNRKHSFACTKRGERWICMGESFVGGPYQVSDLSDLDKYEDHPLHRANASRVH